MFFRSSISVWLLFFFGGVLIVFSLFFFMSLFSSSSLCLFRLSSVEYPSTSLSSSFSFDFMKQLLPFSCFMCCLCQSSKGFSSDFFLRTSKNLSTFFLFLAGHFAIEFCYRFLQYILRLFVWFFVRSSGFSTNTIIFYYFHYHHCLLVFISARNGQIFGLIAERKSPCLLNLYTLTMINNT
jgi:hypothetical protein